MPQPDRPSRRQLLKHLAALAAAQQGLLFAQGAAQVNAPAILRTTLELSNEDVSHLSRGRAVVKTLPTETRREVATGGAIRVTGAIPRFVEQFHTLEGFRRSEFIKQVARFTDPPMPRDLDPLVVERDDLDDLRGCRAGACEIRLPATDIQRFQAEVDWRAQGWPEEASALFKHTLFTYLTRYRAQGLAGLPRYEDDDHPVPVGEHLRALVGQTPSPLDADPHLRAYVLEYPSGPPSGTRDFFYWSKEAFGFKPIVGLNHVCSRTSESGLATMAVLQIYATHYMDAQVAAMTLLPDPDDPRAFYWLYLNRARIDRLTGVLGAITRSIVQRRARSGLAKSLTTTKARLEGVD